ncbi:hypothetical protein J8995_21950 [Klebsiella quasipneumoniae subsp. quasipneumoniae]|uniref:hypothetical protein n=1 Tax=Klebsiella quasipneumoniae TaxID=1463165 RepID=UPI00115889B7|nr:hypothetical protein [Klebsiella quasipneumoniae]HBR1002765.1 hypothetical protein [Klebsiella quasipneumoniae subsp. quasipneumoniae]MBZ6707863.1 hypothetical protein [Klebsiella quasipneumoniae]HBQ8787775.1 hypothetical protein [Klebsiella quasipneumoniae]HBR2087519.1 hypothetical protein [Klebsiella quasipneumoniae subsp. quasipneumoniae]HBT6233296.1 hypothetical protein [Klebsiella quasipneumoniae]
MYGREGRDFEAEGDADYHQLLMRGSPRGCCREYQSAETIPLTIYLSGRHGMIRMNGSDYIAGLAMICRPWRIDNSGMIKHIVPPEGAPVAASV